MAEPMISDWPWRKWANCSPFSVALKAGKISWCWRDLQHCIDALAAGFIQQGVRESSGVVLRSKNTPEALLCYLALLQTGARLLPLNPQLPHTLCDALLPQLDSDFIVDLTGSPLSLDIPSLQIRHAHLTCAADWRPERIATLTLTSGSSGLPKAAAHSIAAHLASAQGVLGLIPFKSGDSWLLSLPLFHVSGQGIIWRWLFAGATLVVAEGQPFDAALAECTHASLVPTQLWRLLEQKHVPESLSHVLLGGAHIPQELTARAELAGVQCWCGYGMTETASTLTAKRANGTSGVGTPLAGKEVILKQNEVWVRASSVAHGYWKHGILIPLIDANGWFATHDRGEWREGELYISGRTDNVFFSGGENVQPEEIERVLLQHPDIQQAFVVPMTEQEFGQRPVALIDATNMLDLSTLDLWLKDKLAGFQRPVHYYRLPESVSNGGIKISRQALINWVLSQ